MKVIVARHLGMCFGVRDALAIATRLPDPSRVTIHGDLVHNEEILRDLERRGFHLTPEDRRHALPTTEETLVTAHGISDREATRLRQAGKRLIDTTCPLVRRVHHAAAAFAREGRLVVVVGRADHVEVKGIVGDLDHWIVVGRPEDVASWDVARIGVVCQTTTAPAEARVIHQRIVACNPASDVHFVNTICRPTRLRQAAVEDLVRRVQALVVVGGRHSNNTRKLADLATSRGLPALLVRGADDLDEDWLRPFAVVGLTAGTSTPSETVVAVHRSLLALASRVNASVA